MLIEIQNKVVSTELFDRKFVCDLNACKGACCVQGDAGAPLHVEEATLLEELLEDIVPFMAEEGIKAVEEDGVFYMDQDNEPVTTLIDGGRCAFVVFDPNGIAKCAVEDAYNAGKIPFKKPVSCHLYPIRVKEFDDFTALNYDRWSICAPACACGEKLDVPVYRFLKEPIVRAFGDAFFEELDVVAREWQNREDAH